MVFPRFRLAASAGRRWKSTTQIRKRPWRDVVKKDDFGVFFKKGVRAIEHNNNVIKNGKQYFIETLGCQMNVADSEIVSSLMNRDGYSECVDPSEADIIFLNTCAIRDKAEEKALQRLRTLRARKKQAVDRPPIVGVLGCMAERMKSRLLEETKLADIVVGPDAYRDLPKLLNFLQTSEDESTAINVDLSYEETYADIKPVRSDPYNVKAFVSIMRGCNNMCSYCIVPFTRGRERSRDPETIASEIRDLSLQGFKEITLLGQNVNSYFFKPESQVKSSDLNSLKEKITAEGFDNLYNGKSRMGDGIRFHNLLEIVAQVDPEMRIRFTSPHPKDFTDEVIDMIAKYPNICNGLHLPVQSGSNQVLDRMRRYYTKEAYIALIQRIRQKIPDVEFSSDFIAGFCGETEEDHKDTLDVIREVRYAQAFLFAYSEREKTHAHRKMTDNISKAVKSRRLSELIAVYKKTGAKLIDEQIGKLQLVLVEGNAKKGADLLMGKTDGLRRVLFPKEVLRQCSNSTDIKKLLETSSSSSCPTSKEVAFGDYVLVRVTEATPVTLKAIPLAITSISAYSSFLKDQLDPGLIE